MAAVFSDIYTLLADQLAVISNLPTVVWENEIETPDENELYLEAYLFPSETEQRTIGTNAPTYESGFLQVNVAGIRGQGWGPAYSWADTICDQFKRNTVLTNSGIDINLKITKSFPRPHLFKDDGRYVVPVDIYYSVHNFT